MARHGTSAGEVQQIARGDAEILGGDNSIDISFGCVHFTCLVDLGSGVLFARVLGRIVLVTTSGKKYHFAFSF
jgi:hypothetical protein